MHFPDPGTSPRSWAVGEQAQGWTHPWLDSYGRPGPPSLLAPWGKWNQQRRPLRGEEDEERRGGKRPSPGLHPSRSDPDPDQFDLG